ncbi:MAG: hypothetical protein QOJ16_679, partial [Acidobacteriota bacterium]|nr:hypothetical protein [Acidobacteriota bacterium]
MLPEEGTGEEREGAWLGRIPRTGDTHSGHRLAAR